MTKEQIEEYNSQLYDHMTAVFRLIEELNDHCEYDVSDAWIQYIDMEKRFGKKK